MNYQFTDAFLFQALPCVFGISLIYILWKRRFSDGVIYLILLEIAASEWAFTDALEHAATTLPLKIFWSQMGNFGSTTTAVFLLLFTLSFSHQQQYITKRFIFLIFTVPLITITLTFTNHWHHLTWSNVILLPQTNDSIYQYGKWFWVFIFYEFALVITSIFILLFSILKFYKIYKNQVVFLIIGALVPLTSSILYVFKITPLKADLTPSALVLSGICVGMGIFWQGMIDIMPIARKQIIDYMGDGVLVIDMADRIIDANPTLVEIIGQSQKQLIGKSFQSLKNELFPSSLTIIENSGETILKLNEKEKFFEVRNNLVSLPNKKIIGRILIFHDITKRKKALDSEVQSNNLLRNEIIEKEKLISDLDAYARSVAHDLKNPISGLLGLKEIIKEDLRNNNIQEILELLDLVHNQGLKMFKIVDELLLLSRIRKEDIAPIKLDMSAIVTEAIKRLNGKINTRYISIELPDSWPAVLGHPQWIEEVWYNLISNAIKYGGNPPVIKLSNEKAGGNTWRFMIRDNGKGLPPESFNKIFNDYERLNEKTTEGHGLGLAIIKRIIEKLGGEVKVISDNIPGNGCVFSFTLSSSE
jgi:PAS domain S-box-containing protein